MWLHVAHSLMRGFEILKVWNANCMLVASRWCDEAVYCGLKCWHRGSVHRCEAQDNTSSVTRCLPVLARSFTDRMQKCIYKSAKFPRFHSILVLTLSSFHADQRARLLRPAVAIVTWHKNLFVCFFFKILFKTNNPLAAMTYSPVSKWRVIFAPKKEKKS